MFYNVMLGVRFRYTAKWYIYITDAGKDWRQKETRVAEDEMIRWYHQLNGNGFEQTPRDSEGQGSLVCCGPWVHRELDMT